MVAVPHYPCPPLPPITSRENLGFRAIATLSLFYNLYRNTKGSLILLSKFQRAIVSKCQSVQSGQKHKVSTIAGKNLAATAPFARILDRARIDIPAAVDEAPVGEHGPQQAIFVTDVRDIRVTVDKQEVFFANYLLCEAD